MARTPYPTLSERLGPRGFTPFVAGLVAVIVMVVGTYAAFTKDNPFDSPYELNAVVRSANNLQRRSAVRIAGVNVGKVTKVEPLKSDEREMVNGEPSGYTRITMQIEDKGLPIKEDAKITIRSRLFLEGNYMVDIEPGSPSAKKLKSGATLPPTQTAFPVQYGQFLSVLQKDARDDLRSIFEEIATAFSGPGATGFNEAVSYWEEAYRDTALVNEATLGTERHDLSRLLKGQGKVLGALARNEEALKNLVSNLNTTAAAFARQEDNLSKAIPELRDVLRVGRPALASLNRALPSLRAFAKEATPGVRSSSPTLDAQLPFIKQARRLVSRDELRGLANDLRATVPDLVRLNRNSAKTFQYTRALSSCQNNVLLPFAKTKINDPDFRDPSNPEADADGEEWYKLPGRAFVGLSGESRLFDANSPVFRVQAGGGPTTVLATGDAGQEYFSTNLFPVEGVRPISPTKRPVFRPNIPCETNEPPDLNAASGGPEQADENVDPNGVWTEANRKRAERGRFEFRKLADHMRRLARGLRTFDPMVYKGDAEKRELQRLGLRRDKDGRLTEDRELTDARTGAEVGAAGAKR